MSFPRLPPLPHQGPRAEQGGRNMQGIKAGLMLLGPVFFQVTERKRHFS